jgi:iron(III) transport system substrate-binding protein
MLAQLFCNAITRKRVQLAVLGAALISTALGLPSSVLAQSKVLNLYSARHYQTDEALYKNFTAKTGIKINLLEAGDEQLLERLRSEGANSPADVILLVDAARLWRAQVDGLFAPIKSSLLDARIPANLRASPEPEGTYWYGMSTRARIIVYNKTALKPERISTYEDLAAPALKGKVCTRAGSHPYMLSWIGAMSEHWGINKTQEWAKAVVSNFARKPRGGDTDQIKGVALGECGAAVTNSYYLARLLRSDKAEDKQMMQQIGIVWPNQASFGAHFNIAGAAVAKHSRNNTAAVQFLEYLASDQAQSYFADGNNEWPAVASLQFTNPGLTAMGKGKADVLPIAQVGRAQIAAQRIVDTAGWR